MSNNNFGDVQLNLKKHVIQYFKIFFYYTIYICHIGESSIMPDLRIKIIHSLVVINFIIFLIYPQILNTRTCCKGHYSSERNSRV